MIHPGLLYTVSTVSLHSGRFVIREFCLIGQHSSGRVRKSGPDCHCEDEICCGCTPLVKISATLFLESVQNHSDGLVSL